MHWPSVYLLEEIEMDRDEKTQLNPLLEAARTAPEGLRWHPRPILEKCLDLLGIIVHKYHAVSKDKEKALIETAQTVLESGVSMNDLSIAAVQVNEAASCCADLNMRDELSTLREQMADALADMRNWNRHYRLLDSAGFCAKCWRVTDYRRNNGYLCQLHAGGSDNPAAKVATRLFVRARRSILATEAELMAKMMRTGFADASGQRIYEPTAEKLYKWPHSDTLVAIYSDRKPEEILVIRRTAFEESTQQLVMKVRRYWGKSSDASIFDTKPLRVGSEINLAHAFRHARSRDPKRAALLLARDKLDPAARQSGALWAALQRIERNAYYTARVLARAQAFLQHSRSRSASKK